MTSRWIPMASRDMNAMISTIRLLDGMFLNVRRWSSICDPEDWENTCCPMRYQVNCRAATRSSHRCSHRNTSYRRIIQTSMIKFASCQIALVTTMWSLSICVNSRWPSTGAATQIFRSRIAAACWPMSTLHQWPHAIRHGVLWIDGRRSTYFTSEPEQRFLTAARKIVQIFAGYRRSDPNATTRGVQVRRAVVCAHARFFGAGRRAFREASLDGVSGVVNPLSPQRHALMQRRTEWIRRQATREPLVGRDFILG